MILIIFQSSLYFLILIFRVFTFDKLTGDEVNETFIGQNYDRVAWVCFPIFAESAWWRGYNVYLTIIQVSYYPFLFVYVSSVELSPFSHLITLALAIEFISLENFYSESKILKFLATRKV